MKAARIVPFIALCFGLLQPIYPGASASLARQRVPLQGDGQKPDLRSAGPLFAALDRTSVLAALQSNHSATLQGGVDVTFVDATLLIALWQPASCAAPGKHAQSALSCEQSMREQALSLARTIYAHFPGVFDEVQCAFFEPQAADLARTYFIKSAWLKANASASKGALLAGIPVVSDQGLSLGDLYRHLSYRQILDYSPLIEAQSGPAGLWAAERKELSDQLTTLRANGYDVTQATGQLLAVEDLVRTRHYSELPQAFARTRQCLAETVSNAKNLSVASSRTESWQR